MAFWGIEVKAGKPVTHSFDNKRGRLRISQATLGIGKAETKSLVQCNVGNKSPVFLCALLPNKTESCHLDLEFEEAEDVVFSVLGPRTVYLTGYYVGNSRRANVNSDTESYGEDIADTETGESCHDSDDDKYDDSFINDAEPEISPPSPASSSGVQDDDENLSDNKLNNNNGGHKRLRKKYQVSESENEDILQESEDEDTCLLSALKKTDVTPVASEDNQKNDMLSAEVPHRTENGVSVESKKANINSKKKRKRLEGNGSKLIEANTSSDTKDREDKANLVDVGLAMTTNMKDGQSDTLDPFAEEDSSHVPKSKKRKHSVEAKSVENHDTNCDIILKVDQLKQDPLKAGHLGEDPIAIDEEDQKLNINNSIDGKSDSVADGHQLDKKLKKKKKKKSKSQEDCMVNMDLPVLQENEMNRQSVNIEDKSLKVKSTVIKTLSNGLTIEELAVGAPGGKLAAPGKKIKVHYTGKLKENGQIFYTNMGKSPYKFRLGDKDVIEGWNLGLDGMRVGDKRRLTVPPSVGYGSQGAGENIPPNSWLVFDIELIGVRG
ncbi:peptidyl-prolyl cis-trans isomerase FKBP43-like isoform X2 [Solanum dulcamara]|uniref:peptidyl-prolyl cis-trans isomerase FKBP43-like isoform X2 n=1 Tax=Solanum dulcamara TaxID=45834 RepID=UPI002485C171|nr:peptidyl-prolyl cis-trans isomerase FKBP43-like isoform X2 [Solanum dulcamara]